MNKLTFIKIYLHNRKNNDALDIFDGLEELSKIDSAFSTIFHGWLNNESSTLVLRDMAERVTGLSYLYGTDHRNKINSIDTASHIYRCSNNQL